MFPTIIIFLFLTVPLKSYCNSYPPPYPLDHQHHQDPYNHVAQELQNIHDDVANQYQNHVGNYLDQGYPTGPPPPQAVPEYQDRHQYQQDQHHQQYQHEPSPSAASCLSRIRLAASFDPLISSKINRFIDSMRIDRLRAYVCERTAFFCDEHQQKEVGDLFHQYDKSIEIIDQVRHQLTSTEKDQLNMMENLNDTLAEQAFFTYKFHQLNPVDLAVLTSAKTSLTAALSATPPDGALSKAMGSFSPQDLERLATLPVNHLPEEVRSHLARCQITAPEVVHDTVAFLLSVMGSKQNNT